MGWFDSIQQGAKRKAFELCVNQYNLDGQKGLNPEELAGFITQMCKKLGVPLKCYTWQAKLAMKLIDKNSNGVADLDQLYRVFLKAQGVITGEEVPQDEKRNFHGQDWRIDGKHLGYEKGIIGRGMPASCLGYFGHEENLLPYLQWQGAQGPSVTAVSSSGGEGSGYGYD